ncbi:methyltransferase [Coleofasciculus sp.]|uniref:methyltransferase n=1 Tax=Coleofasciculus sp. TaxID=3100458 RepID=UPI003A289732
MVNSSNLKDIFFCPEESNFYSLCLENLVLNHCNNSEVIIEFGSGDGTPVINSLLKTELKTEFHGLIYGFEINKLAWKSAQSKIQEHQLSTKYIIQNESLFDVSKPDANYLISNPPYLPAADDKIYHPLLYGGNDGSTIAKRLLSLGYKNILLLVCSYSNPKALINYAITQGYNISNFIISPLKFGYYSSEPKVKNTIVELQKESKAFYSKNIYLIAGVLFCKQDEHTIDLSTELLQVITSL